MESEKHDNPAIEKTVSFDEIEPDEVQLIARRQKLYSKNALRAALPIDGMYANHTRFAGGLHALDRLFQIAPEVTMSHGLKLIGPTGSGKSALFRYFRDSLPRSSLFTPGFGAVGIRAGPNSTAGQILSALLRVYKYPFRNGSSSTVYARMDIVLDLIREKRTRLLFVDEAHRLLKQKKVVPGDDREPSATVLLRDLMDEGQIALVLAGTNVLDNLQDVDPHLSDRLSVRHELCYFQADKEWVGLMHAFVKQSTSFDIGIIANPSDAKLLHIATGGSLRRFKRLLTESVLIAAHSGLTVLDSASIAKGLLAVQGHDSRECSPYA